MARVKKVGKVGGEIVLFAIVAYPAVLLMSFGDINDQILKVVHRLTGG
jgi:hypothetical protein